MKTKLTLSLEADTIKIAKSIAAREGRTISSLVSEFFNLRAIALSDGAIPTARSMVGSLKGYDIPATKAAIREAYAKKHLR